MSRFHGHMVIHYPTLDSPVPNSHLSMDEFLIAVALHRLPVAITGCSRDCGTFPSNELGENQFTDNWQDIEQIMFSDVEE